MHIDISKQIRNLLNSNLINDDIAYYSNQLELHRTDLVKSWKVLKTIIGKGETITNVKLALISLT